MSDNREIVAKQDNKIAEERLHTPEGDAESLAGSEKKTRPFRRLLAGIQEFMHWIAGTEIRRFITGSVIVPLLIAGVSITIGAQIASDFQDWQDRKSRARDIADGMREAASSLSVNLDALAVKGSGIERITWAKQDPIEENRAVKDSLERLQGMSTSLRNGVVVADRRVDQATIAAEITSCRKAVDDYMACLAGVVVSSETREEQPCTDSFREAIKAKGSCQDLRLNIYSLVF